MANIFALTITSVTLLTGILWCLEHLKQKLNFSIQFIKTGASFFPLFLSIFIVRSFIFEPFQIPSGSMMPTLLIGDFILVNKFTYGIKNPITNSTLIEMGHPKRGDIVVFKYPLDPTLDYIKRVIGLPGDWISYDPVDKRIIVQPQPYCMVAQDQKDCIITYTDTRPSNFVQKFYSNDKGEIISNFIQLNNDQQIVKNGIRLNQRKEYLGGVVHNILTIPDQRDPLSIYYRQPGKLLAEWVVPQGTYFMMGDNRDNSSDSRYWGFVPEKNIVGKATIIWVSINKQKGHWPISIRFNRIGSSIN